MSSFILRDVMNCVYIVKVEAIHGPLLSLRIMVPLEKMQTNYSVPCHKGDGDNTLATRYNHKIIHFDDTYWLFSLP